MDKNHMNNNNLKLDPVLKDYWRNNDRFADLFNQVLFHGKPIISSSKLTDRDTEESTIYMDKEQIAAITRARDLIKQYDDGIQFTLIGLENQMNVHYAIPVRTMLYDALRYTKECKQLEQRHRMDKDLKGTDEFLSGITKEDKIKPVITIVLYYGEKPWDGPLQLSDMMDIPPIFQSFFNEQKIYLIQLNDTARNLDFQNTDNQDFFTMIHEFYKNDGKIDFYTFKTKYPNKEIYWETLAAIGAATGAVDLITYARKLPVYFK